MSYSTDQCHMLSQLPDHFCGSYRSTSEYFVKVLLPLVAPHTSHDIMTLSQKLLYQWHWVSEQWPSHVFSNTCLLEITTIKKIHLITCSQASCNVKAVVCPWKLIVACNPNPKVIGVGPGWRVLSKHETWGERAKTTMELKRAAYCP